MPMYLYEDKKSGKRIEVLRSFKEYDVPPTKEEAPDIEDPQWERLIIGTQKHVKGPGFGRKGYW